MVVCGAGGFIGGHLVKGLLKRGVDVIRAVDIKPLDVRQGLAETYLWIERQMTEETAAQPCEHMDAVEV